MGKHVLMEEKICPNCEGAGGRHVDAHDCWGKDESYWDKCGCCGGEGVVYEKVEPDHTDIEPILPLPPQPVSKDEIKKSAIIKMAETVVDDILDRGYMDEDTPQYLFEELMTIVYGGNFFKWYNEYTRGH